MRRSCTLTPEQICGWACGLREQEHSPGTIKNYLRHVRSFSAWLDGREVTREAAGQWKAALVEAGYAPATVNAMLAALNRFFVFQGWEECRVKALRLQKKLFREAGRELVRADYEKLLDAAERQGRPRLVLLMEAICATGIRVSEVEIPHGRGGPAWKGGDQPQGQDPDDPASQQAVPEAAEIRPKAKDRLR